MKLDLYQRRSRGTDQRQNTTSEINQIIPLLGLVGEIGSVAAEHKKRLRDGKAYSAFKQKFKEELGDVLWYVATLADDLDLKMSDVAKSNLKKLKERWSETSRFTPHHLLDEDFKKEEQLPRRLTVRFVLTSSKKVQLFSGKKPIGHKLTDNAHVDDGYRFHDVFHLAYMAKLGWSPVFRKILERKRRSRRRIDEVEDGARAMIIEEAIAAMVYEHAKDHRFFENIDTIDYNLLRTIKGIVGNFEVKNMPTKLWEEAIIDGFKVFRKLRANNGGKVQVDLRRRSIKYMSL
jgi:NTP pyrophosphatase (non-canonical NTP hydrolase)